MQSCERQTRRIHFSTSPRGRCRPDDEPAQADLELLQRLGQRVGRPLFLLQDTCQFSDLLVDYLLVLRVIVALHQRQLLTQRRNLIVLGEGRKADMSITVGTGRCVAGGLFA